MCAELRSTDPGALNSTKNIMEFTRTESDKKGAPAMNNRTRYIAHSLAGFSIVLTLLLGCPEIRRSRAKAHAGTSNASLVPGNAGMVEEGTATLKPAQRFTFTHTNSAYPSNKVSWPCG